MNKKNIFIYFLLALPFLLTSCLKDQEDLFPDSASARSAKYLDNVKKVLTSAEYGWALDYFPDREQSYGGYSYTLKFGDENAEICFELADDVTESLTSTYILNNESGPVLMFDTYNEYIHYFATPSGSSSAGGYEAYDGDFIFMIMNVSDDKNTITLKGVRSGNVMYMHKIDQSIQSYQSVMEQFKRDLVFDQAVGVFDTLTYHLAISAVERYITVESDNEAEEAVEAPFCFDTDGFTLYKPITIAGKEVRVFKYNQEQGTFVSAEDNSIVFTALLTPSIVTNNIGESINIGNGAVTLDYTFNLADKFVYKTDVDWITVTADGNNVTVQIAANNTGASRSGNIIVETELGTSAIVVTQLPLHEIFLGSATFVAYSNISAAARPYFDACKALSDGEGETISQMVFVNIDDDAQYGYGIYFVSGNYAGMIALDVTSVGDKEIKFTYAPDRNYSNGTWYYRNGYNTLIDYLESTTFKISSDNDDNPSYFIFTDSQDDTKYFKLTTTAVSNPFAN